MKKKVYATPITCIYLECPRLAVYIAGVIPERALYLAPSETFKDVLDNPWCPQCKHRGELLNWGHAHHFPAMSVPPFAVEQGQYLWHVMATMGSEAYVQALLAVIRTSEEEV